MTNTAPSNAANISFGLAGRVCVVTGGAQGIGEACIRRFARENAQVVIADIDDVRGSALASELGGLFVHCDVGDKAQVDALVAQTMAAHGRIDVLVNNAGIFKAADFLDVSEADFDAVLRINLKGSFLVGQAVARVMAKADARTGISGSASRGSIVNMSSVNAVLTIPTIAGYNVSKGGINQLTRVMALALADKGIRVNAVAPGTIAMFARANGRRHVYNDLVLRAFFQEDQDIGRIDVLVQIALRTGLDPADFEAALRGDRDRDAHEHALSMARTQGVSSAPAFRIGQRWRLGVQEASTLERARGGLE